MKLDIVFIRHGWSEGNEHRLLYGRTDLPLTEKGKETLRGYREQYVYPETERYYSSPLTRCRETFACLYPDKKLDAIREDFIEISFGDAEGESEMFAGGYDEYFRRWNLGERLWNGEDIHELRSRADRALRHLCRDMLSEGVHSATVVCHSGIMKAVLMNLGLMGLDFMSIFIHQGMGWKIEVEYDGKELKVLSGEECPVKTMC